MATTEELVEALREALYEEGYVQPYGPVRGSDYLTADTPESERPAAIAALRAADAEVERANDALMERVIASIAPIIRADERERLLAQVEALPSEGNGLVWRKHVLALLGGGSDG